MRPAEDEIIHNILKAIIDKWREREASLREESDLMETVILSPGGIPSHVRDGGEWTETVLLSAKGVGTGSSPLSPRDIGSDPVLETVVLGAGAAKPGPSKPAAVNEDEPTVLETIIILPGMYPEGTFGARNCPDAGAAGEWKGTDNGDALSETVILPPRQTNLKTKKWKD